MPDRPVETVRAEKMAAGGDAIAHLADGRVVFVDGALPGEDVRVEVHSDKRDFARARVLDVLTPSHARVQPPCPELARGCGGCAWQHVEPTAQRSLKAEIVADALRRTAKLDAASVVDGGGVPPWAYRTTMRLAVGTDGRVGLRGAASHDVIALDACMVAHPALSALLPAVRVRGAKELTLRVSAATGEVTAMADRPGARITGLPPSALVGAEAVLHEDVLGARLRVSAGSFFQSGPAAAALLVGAVMHAAGERLTIDGPVLDAFGGVGLFAAALPLRDAVIVESSRSACADARVNVPEAEVVCTPFERWTPRPVEWAVVDPARAGLGRDAAAVLAAAGPRRVVLVSCDPVSLARDAVLLAAHGYSLRDSVVLDLFPHTPHVEVVSVFDRA